ncbi:MAG: hypothetical protein JKY94_16720 [Rhodobacteraceae bacterium]|nr:hypothetical protein [Paracoccaceae bacterium]
MMQKLPKVILKVLAPFVAPTNLEDATNAVVRSVEAGLRDSLDMPKPEPVVAKASAETETPVETPAEAPVEAGPVRVTATQKRAKAAKIKAAKIKAAKAKKAAEEAEAEVGNDGGMPDDLADDVGADAGDEDLFGQGEE